MTVLEYQSPQRAIPIRPVLSVTERVVYAMFGIALPGVCFLISAGRYPGAAEWQNGEWSAPISLIPSGRNCWPIYPLLMYSMFCLGAFIAKPVNGGGKYFVRCGLVSGIILAVQFGLIQTIALGRPPAFFSDELVGYLAMGFGVTAIALLALWVIRICWRWQLRLFFWGLGLILLSGIVLPFIAPDVGRGAIGIALFGSLAFAPALTLAVFISATVISWKFGVVQERKSNRFWLPIGWVIAWLGAWRIAYTSAVASYALLPKTAPDCYIATAAKRGHPWIVSDDQVRNLKNAELAIKALSPPLHAAMRSIYDCIGPVLAKKLVHPLLADLAYLTLKPIEWIAIFVMWIFLEQSLTCTATRR